MAINSMQSGFLITTLVLLICFADYLGADSLMTSLTLCCLFLSLCCLEDQTVSSFSTKNTNVCHSKQAIERAAAGIFRLLK